VPPAHTQSIYEELLINQYDDEFVVKEIEKLKEVSVLALET
jgi:hypothetical protein